MGIGLALGNLLGGVAQGYDSGTIAATQQNALANQIALQNNINNISARMQNGGYNIPVQAVGTAPASDVSTAAAPQPDGSNAAPAPGLLPNGQIDLSNSAGATSPAAANSPLVAAADAAAPAPTPGTGLQVAPQAYTPPAPAQGTGLPQPADPGIQVGGGLDQGKLYQDMAAAAMQAGNPTQAAQFMDMAQSAPLKAYQLSATKTLQKYYSTGDASTLAQGMADAYNANVHDGQYMRATALPQQAGPDGQPQPQQIQVQLLTNGKWSPSRVVDANTFATQAMNLANPDAYMKQVASAQDFQQQAALERIRGQNAINTANVTNHPYTAVQTTNPDGSTSIHMVNTQTGNATGAVGGTDSGTQDPQEIRALDPKALAQDQQAAAGLIAKWAGGSSLGALTGNSQVLAREATPFSSQAIVAPSQRESYAKSSLGTLAQAIPKAVPPALAATYGVDLANAVSPNGAYGGQRNGPNTISPAFMPPAQLAKQFPKLNIRPIDAVRFTVSGTPGAWTVYNGNLLPANGALYKTAVTQ